MPRPAAFAAARAQWEGTEVFVTAEGGRAGRLRGRKEETKKERRKEGTASNARLTEGKG